MSLKLLLNNSSLGIFLYPNHNTPSSMGGFNYGQSTTRLFDGGTFRQKSFKFGQGTANDRPYGGFSGEPFVTSPTIDLLSGNPGLETTINTFTDGFIRGGAIMHAERLLTDGERIGRFLITPKGLAFIAKQVGLQKTNPKISKPGVNFSRANQRTYNLGVNTLASVVTAGTGLYVKREGLLPTAFSGYAQAKKIFRDDDNNRLINLFEDQIEAQTSSDIREKERSRIGQFFYNIGQGLKKVKKFLVGGSDGETLYGYNGGPGSLFGIGRTRVRKYPPFTTDVGENGIPRAAINTGYLDGAKFRVGLGSNLISTGVSNAFAVNYRELSGVDTDQFQDLHLGLQQGYDDSGFFDIFPRYLKGSKDDINDASANPIAGYEKGFRYVDTPSRFLPNSKFYLTYDNLQSGLYDGFNDIYSYLQKPSKTGLSDFLLRRKETGERYVSDYSNVSNYLQDYDFTPYLSYDEYDPEESYKISDAYSTQIYRFGKNKWINTFYSTRKVPLDADALIGETEFYSEEGGIGDKKGEGITGIDSYHKMNPENSSLSKFSKLLYGSGYDSKVMFSDDKGRYANVVGGSGGLGAFDVRTELTLGQDLSSDDDQQNPELKLSYLNPFTSDGYWQNSGFIENTNYPAYGELWFVHKKRLAYNPISFHSYEEDPLSKPEDYTGKEFQTARLGWMMNYYNLGDVPTGNPVLISKYLDPKGDGSKDGTLIVQSPHGTPEVKSAEWQEIEDEIIDEKYYDAPIAAEFDHVSYFTDNPNYTLSHTSIQDFRKIKKEALGKEFIQPFTDYQQETNRGKKYYREDRVNLGNPGKKIDGVKGKNVFGGNTESYDIYDPDTIDKINALDIFKAPDGNYERAEIRDLIRFRVEALDGDDPSASEVMVFRAFLDSYSDNYQGMWNNFKYNGRAENFYTYNGFDRKISFAFKIAAQSRHEMIPLYRKLNYLVSQTAPDYKGTRMRGTFVRLTIGAMIDRTPGFFTSINLKWNKAYPWDISLSHLENGEDKDGMQVMPHIMDVNCQFTPIHNFVPKKSIKDSPFILSHENNRTLKRRQRWYSYGAAPSVSRALLRHKSKLA